MNLILAVAAGGALGALGRYVVITRVGHWLGTDFPFGTLVVNVTGSFGLGLLTASVTAVGVLPPEALTFATVGVLGGFTTFSTFALDVAFLGGRRSFAAAAAYILASVVLSLAGLLAGLYLARLALA